MSLLQAEHINTGYGKKQVLFDVSLEVEKGEKILLIGSNGSGKSTLLKSIFGELTFWDKKSSIYFNDEDITSVAPYKLIKKGLMYIPQQNELFEDMSIQENLQMSVLHLNDSHETKIRLADVYEKMPNLKLNRKQVVNQLSGGERKKLSLGMVLMNKPQLLLYDEPLAGLSGDNIKEVLYWLHHIHKNGTTIVIVEHRVKELLNFVDRIVGLKLGKRNVENLDNLETIKRFIL